MEKTAIILGATGLTGNHLLSLLVTNNDYDKIIMLTRKVIPVAGNKLSVVVTDFSDMDAISKYIKGDEIFCCIGTTLAKAGSIKEFKRVDYDIPYKIALEGIRNGVKSFYLISSIGANAKSFNYYTKTKGRLERDIISLSFEKTVIVRPSMLLGDRTEYRFGEMIGKMIMWLFKWLLVGPLKKYCAIDSRKVAKFLIEARNYGAGVYIIESDKLQSVEL